MLAPFIRYVYSSLARPQDANDFVLKAPKSTQVDFKPGFAESSSQTLKALYLEKCRLNFSSSSFVIRVNLLHP